MSCTTYYERRQKIDRHEAQKLEEVLGRQKISAPRNVLTRRLRFESLVPKNGEGRYSICMMDFDENQIYLELKYIQRGITYKKLAKLSREDCMRILEGAWNGWHPPKIGFCRTFTGRSR